MEFIRLQPHTSINDFCYLFLLLILGEWVSFFNMSLNYDVFNYVSDEFTALGDRTHQFIVFSRSTCIQKILDRAVAKRHCG